jgi:hypothetical protein
VRVEGEGRGTYEVFVDALDLAAERCLSGHCSVALRKLKMFRTGVR